MESIFRESIYLVANDEMLVYFVDTMFLASVLISLLLLIRPWMKRLPRIGMYVMWITLGLRLMVPVDLFNFFPEEIHGEVMDVANQMKVHTIAAKFQIEELDKFGGRENNYRLSQQDVPPSASETGEAEREVTSRTEHREQARSVIGVLQTVWILGFLFLLIYMLESMLWVRLRLCDAKLVDENVYTHPLINNSFVAGWSNPRIYLSERVEECDRRTILCHERIHIQRRDPLIKRIMFLLCAVFWINPLMWIAYRCMVEDMEISCDEAVLRKFGEHKKKYYSALLLQMSEVSNGCRKPYTAFCAGEVGRRIRHILKYHEHGRLFCSFCAIFTCCAMGWILSIPGVKALSSSAEITKSVYVEQSFCFPEREGSRIHINQRLGKDTLYVQEGRLYTCLTDQGKISGVARRCGDKWLKESVVSSELRQQIERKQKVRNVQRERSRDNMVYIGEGEGFYVNFLLAGNMPHELLVFNQKTGREQYRIPLDEYFEGTAEQTSSNFQAGVSGDRIYFVCDQGIFEVKYGTQEIHLMVSARADNVYYLSDDQSEYCDIVRGVYDDYYVAIRRGEEHIICHYGIRKVRVIR